MSKIFSLSCVSKRNTWKIREFIYKWVWVDILVKILAVENEEEWKIARIASAFDRISDVAAAIRDSVLFADKWPIWKPARSRDGRDIDGHIPLPSGSDCARRRCCRYRRSLLHYSFGRRQRRSINNVSSCCRRTARRLTKDIPLHAPSDILPQDRAAVTDVTRGRATWNSSRSNIGSGILRDLHDVATPWNRREYASIIDFPIHRIYLCRPLIVKY